VTHTYGDRRLVAWLAEHGYHPRSPKHGRASCLYFLADLIESSDRFRAAAKEGDIVYREDYTVGDREREQLHWNADLVVGPPANSDVDVPHHGDPPIAEGTPGRVWLAVDAKSVMTEHGKARRNRQRDVNSFADIMNHHHPGAVTGGLLLLNMADRFRSPLREEGDITEHNRIERLVEETVAIFRDIDRADGDVSPNVDGVGCIVVEHTNMDDGDPTQLVTEPPAPQPEDAVNYRTFLETIAKTVEKRWLVGDSPAITDDGDSEDPAVVLNHDIIEVAHLARLIGDGIEEAEVPGSLLDEFEDELDEIRDVIAEVRDQYGTE